MQKLLNLELLVTNKEKQNEFKEFKQWGPLENDQTT